MTIVAMESKTGKMRCGNCGFDKYELFCFEDRLDLKCSQCESVSQLKPQIPRLQIKWGDGPKDLGLPTVY